MGDSDLAWITTVCRPQHNMGFDVLYARDNSCIITSPRGNATITQPNRGLKFGKYQVFKDFRRALTKRRLWGSK